MAQSCSVVLPQILTQHAEEAVAVFELRSVSLRRPDVKVSDFLRIDRRLVAHLDGLAIAGESALAVCDAMLDRLSAGIMFVAGVQSIAERSYERLERLVALANVVGSKGLTAAFGWVRPDQLRGLAAALLNSHSGFQRAFGIAACAVHRVDPALERNSRLNDQNPLARARALRSAGELGIVELAQNCAHATDDSDRDCRFWAAWSSVLLGNRTDSLQVLKTFGRTVNNYRRRALELSFQAMDRPDAHALLQTFVAEGDARVVINGSGLTGDPVYVGWLVKQMNDAENARAAAEAFSLISGADLGKLQLTGQRPDGFEPGPNDDPDDRNVAIDPDEGLPWPDVQKIQVWWHENEHRFKIGTRYFMGAPVTREHCIDVLKNGYQRQRILAAHYLCLLEPGTPLFNTSAPAWRQQRWLAKM